MIVGSASWLLLIVIAFLLITSYNFLLDTIEARKTQEINSILQKYGQTQNSSYP